jgi:hypothetical protein
MNLTVEKIIMGVSRAARNRSQRETALKKCKEKNIFRGACRSNDCAANLEDSQETALARRRATSHICRRRQFRKGQA